MALLWHSVTKTTNKTLNPSPTNYPKSTAQTLKRTIKGLSLFIPFPKSLRAGMTVEAAVVLPLFLLFFLNLASYLEIIRLYGNVQLALWETGNKASLYSYAMGEEAAGSLLPSIYIKSQMISALGKEYLERSPMEDGAAGMRVMAELSGEKDILKVTVYYRVEPLSRLAGFPAFWLSNCYYTHIWSGYDISGAKDSQVVYVTESGSVYHMERSCTHLLLSIRPAAARELDQLRNQWGRAYGACEKCTGGIMPDSVYITGEGESYHYSKNCAGLKRTVYALTLMEAQKEFRSCSRCGGEQLD